MDDVVIIKSKVLLRQEQADELFKKFEEQSKKGIVVLPSFCEAIYSEKYGWLNDNTKNE